MIGLSLAVFGAPAHIRGCLVVEIVKWCATRDVKRRPQRKQPAHMVRAVFLGRLWEKLTGEVRINKASGPISLG